MADKVLETIKIHIADIDSVIEVLQRIKRHYHNSTSVMYVTNLVGCNITSIDIIEKTLTDGSKVIDVAWTAL